MPAVDERTLRDVRGMAERAVRKGWRVTLEAGTALALVDELEALRIRLMVREDSEIREALERR
jgi:hypothetical protein